MDPRPSARTMAVLEALRRDPLAWRYGYELIVELGVKAGSLYPILMRLAERGLLESSWEPSAAAPRVPSPSECGLNRKMFRRCPRDAGASLSFPREFFRINDASDVGDNKSVA